MCNIYETVENNVQKANFPMNYYAKHNQNIHVFYWQVTHTHPMGYEPMPSPSTLVRGGSAI
jgi:hypothetical protein